MIRARTYETEHLGWSPSPGAGAPRSKPSVLRSSSTSGQWIPYPAPATTQQIDAERVVGHPDIFDALARARLSGAHSTPPTERLVLAHQPLPAQFHRGESQVPRQGDRLEPELRRAIVSINVYMVRLVVLVTVEVEAIRSGPKGGGHPSAQDARRGGASPSSRRSSSAALSSRSTPGLSPHPGTVGSGRCSACSRVARRASAWRSASSINAVSVRPLSAAARLASRRRSSFSRTVVRTAVIVSSTRRYVHLQPCAYNCSGASHGPGKTGGCQPAIASRSRWGSSSARKRVRYCSRRKPSWTAWSRKRRSRS